MYLIIFHYLFVINFPLSLSSPSISFSPPFSFPLFLSSLFLFPPPFSQHRIILQIGFFVISLAVTDSFSCMSALPWYLYVVLFLWAGGLLFIDELMKKMYRKWFKKYQSLPSLLPSSPYSFILSRISLPLVNYAVCMEWTGGLLYFSH
jgi:hypothetical protein